MVVEHFYIHPGSEAFMPVRQVLHNMLCILALKIAFDKKSKKNTSFAYQRTTYLISITKTSKQKHLLKPHGTERIWTKALADRGTSKAISALQLRGKFSFV